MSHSAVPAADRTGSAPSADDRDWMLERTVVHKIVVGLAAAHPALSDVLDQLARSGGRLGALDVRPLGQGFEAVLRVEALAPEGARRLVDRYALLPEITTARVEHMLVR